MINRFAAVVLAAISFALAPATWAQSDAPVTISIEESQSLSDALQSFADQTDLQVIFFADITEGKTTSGVEGEYPVDAVLDTLLADTGLSYTFIDDTAVSVQAIATSERGASDSKNLSAGPMPVLMAQNTSPTQTTSIRSDNGGTSIVTGRVTDARTGANLKGAKVRVEETGQWTSTGDLGRFRLVNVPAGSVTLTVSFLGYAGQQAVVSVHGDGTSQNFALRGGSEVDEIVVFGTRSGRAQALNLERTAENMTTVASADLLGGFPGTTVSEALRRLPGISFQRDELTGDGSNIVIRGLEPDLNTVTLNGLRLPVGSGVDRSANLNNLLTESISKITISKTLLPHQDSSGTGGLIDIETKAPLDRPRRFANFGYEVGQTKSGFLDDALISGTVSGTFGQADNWGLSASIQYRDREIKRLNYSVDSLILGQYLPLADDGSLVSSRDQIDPRTPFPFEPGVNEVYPRIIRDSQNGVETSSLSTTLSAQLKLQQHTDLRFDYVRSEESRDSFDRQVVISPFFAELPLPVDELNGETRYALVWEDGLLPGFFFGPTHSYSISRDDEDVTEVISINGRTEQGRWSSRYKVGYTKGENQSPYDAFVNVNRPFGAPPDFFPVRVDPAFLAEAAFENTIDGRVVYPYAPLSGDDYPLPLFNEAGFAHFNDASNYTLGTGGTSGFVGENDRSTAELSTRYEFEDGVFKYIEIGAYFEVAEFRSFPDRRTPTTSYASPTSPTLSSLGLEFTTSNLADIGRDGGFAVANQHDVERFLNGLPAMAAAGRDVVATVFDRDPRTFDAYTEEREFAAFIQGRIDLGDFEFIGGVRFTEVDVQAVNLLFPTLVDERGVSDEGFREQFSVLADQRATESAVLPRLLVNYRPTENLVVRGGYYQSVARPRIFNLSRNKQLFLDLRPTFGPDANQPQLFVREGNPGLEPAVTNNYDLSLEFYDDAIGVIKVGAFYKDIENLLEIASAEGFDVIDGVELPDDPRFQNLPSNIFVAGERPFNSPFDATIWGVEAAIEKQFTSLPSGWDGLGMYLNHTYTDSSKTVFLDFTSQGITQTFLLDDVAFNQQPRNSGTLALTYSGFDLDMSLAYTKQDRTLASLSSQFGMHEFREEYDSLDFRAEYNFDTLGARWRVYVEGADLLKGTSDPDVQTAVGGVGAAPKIFKRGNFYGGRSFRVGFTSSFSN